MRGRAEAWFGYAEEDYSAAERLVDSHPTVAAYHAHQAAEKGLKALQIDREGDYERTHDLVRLSHQLDVPAEFRSVLEDLDQPTRLPGSGRPRRYNRAVGTGIERRPRPPDMDTETIDRVTENLESTAEKLGLTLGEVIVFGSRVRDDYRPKSDIDLLMVSSDFEDVPAYKRPKLFFRHWDYDTLPDPEFICLTPAEFEERRRKEPHLVRTTVDEGVSVA